MLPCPYDPFMHRGMGGLGGIFAEVLRPRRLTLMCCVCLALLARPAALDEPVWHTYQGSTLRVRYAKDRPTAVRVAAIGDALFADVAARFPLPRGTVVDVWLTDSSDEFADIVHAPIRDWAMGYAFPEEGRIVLRLPSGPGRLESLDQLTRHEVAHICLGALVGGRASEAPIWFHEGFAMYVSEHWDWRHQWTLLISHLFRQLPTLDALSHAFPADADDARIAYTQSFSAVRLLILERSMTRFHVLLSRLAEGDAFESAFEATYGLSTMMYDVEWRESATDGAQWLLLLGGSMTLVALVTPFVVVGYVRFRRERNARLEEWARKEAEPDSFFRG